MWKKNDKIIIRNIINNKVLFSQSVQVIDDSYKETTLLLSAGNQYAGPESYFNKNFLDGARWLEAETDHWNLKITEWKTTNLLIILFPKKYYSVNIFVNAATNEFICYYVNFQLPYKRSKYGFDTLDLDLDIVVNKDLSWKWKDLEDYEKGIALGGIKREWADAIESEKKELFSKINNALYPFNESKLKILSGFKPEKCFFPKGWDEYNEEN